MDRYKIYHEDGWIDFEYDENQLYKIVDSYGDCINTTIDMFRVLSHQFQYHLTVPHKGPHSKGSVVRREIRNKITRLIKLNKV